MLCLHLIQLSLVYYQHPHDPASARRTRLERPPQHGRTVRHHTRMIHDHINPYGSLRLDYSRLPLDRPRFGPQSVGGQLRPHEQMAG